MDKYRFSRRKFLKTAGVAGAMTSLSPIDTLANDEVQVPDQFKGFTFLFQGDSITDGKWGRNNDPNHILGHGYVFSVASRIGADFPQSGFSFYNRGISGNKVSDLDKRWSTDTLALKPDVLSLLIGINDVGALVANQPDAGDLEAFGRVYRKLLKTSLEINPDLLLVLGIPFVFPVGARKEKWELWHEATLARAQIIRMIAEEFDAILIDFASLFEQAQKSTPIDYWIWDGVHPTVFGHELMAREWIKQVGSRLAFLKSYHY
ncbi:GDSL-type esterase/lipase family protein [Gaoshiqia sediminis]|uniref:GDSL-type esterase/lipase family protein n=1 Tax=Gaoshiqia sediminis TaxID=2986998 RepID=A0AA41Y5F4_9BACT|nr:GDSL-type esterase/lipase family protein [Gaoshiqia sediminis]MCW0481856.1 GDSL-type esterase/lipase family protein [Gaoshiqia sediminis]